MAIGVSWSVVATIWAAVVVGMTITTTSWLRHVWDHLHASRNYSCWTATSGSVGRCCRSPKSLRELLKKRATDIVGGNVNSISNAKYNE
jgi:hypothetical protein